VLFIAATADAKIPRVRVAHQQRIAADEARFRLATPPPSPTAVAMVSKYVVIVAGGPGHLRKSPISPSDMVIAFALPQVHHRASASFSLVTVGRAGRGSSARTASWVRIRGASELTFWSGRGEPASCHPLLSACH
jgi:hypothetical protein